MNRIKIKNLSYSADATSDGKLSAVPRLETMAVATALFTLPDGVLEVKKRVFFRAFDMMHVMSFINKTDKHVSEIILKKCNTAVISRIETYHDTILFGTEVRVKPLRINSPYTQQNIKK